MADIRRISEEYTALMKDIIEGAPELEHIRNSDVQIMALASEHKKTSNGKTIFAQCEKVAEKYKWAIPCDFTITVFEPNVVDFSWEQIEILMFHELLHVGVEQDENGEDKYKIVPHDLEDFKTIIDRYGTEWNRTE